MAAEEDVNREKYREAAQNFVYHPREYFNPKGKIISHFEAYEIFRNCFFC
jgi:hypothetical protein